MEEFRLIELHRTRDFGKKINATFEFIKQNFKSLGKSILFIAGPAVLIGSLMIGSFMGDFFGTIFSNAMGSGNPEALEKFFLSFNFWAQFVLAFVFILLAMVMSVSTINNYILLYHEKKTNEISVQEVWDRVRSSIGMYIGSSFLLFLFFILAYIVVVLVIVIFGVASPVLSVFGVFIGIGAMAYLWISISLTLFIQTFEKKNFFSAMSRSVKLVHGKWWSTFGLLLILAMIGYFISYIFIIPYYAVMFSTMLHKVSHTQAVAEGPSKYLTILFFTLYYAVYLLTNALPNIGVAFQYFNLVELKEAKGLMAEIENVGKAEEPQRPEESY
jgi:hypothetical protein